MRTSEFLEKYPQWVDVYESRWREPVGVTGQYQTWVRCRCSICGVEKKVRWSPCIVHNCSDDGIYLCWDCIDFRGRALKQQETKGPEVRSRQARLL